VAADLVALVGLVGMSDTHQRCQVASGSFLATLQVPAIQRFSPWLVNWRLEESRRPAVAGGLQHSSSPRLA
jgi:hypothetical protein